MKSCHRIVQKGLSDQKLQLGSQVKMSEGNKIKAFFMKNKKRGIEKIILKIKKYFFINDR